MAIKNPQKQMDSAKRRRRQTKQTAKEQARELRAKHDARRKAARASALK